LQRRESTRVEVTTLKTVGASGMRGPAPLLRLASDERLVVLTRRGNHAAFEALVARYQSRLLAFCRHMLSSREDAEDVLQEVFAAAFNAMLADERAINVRPWLYRIARNRSLNHLRKATAVGVDSMDVHVAEHGTTTAEKAHRREEFRLLMADVQTLPETQRTALLLREIDALSYEQIAEAMDTTIPAVKSLLVRARVSLAEAAEARTMSCAEVREELGKVAEGITQRMAAPVRRHLRTCDRCTGFRKQLRETNKALAAVYPVGPLLFLKKAILAQLGTTASAGGAAAGAGSAAAGTAAAGGAGALASGVGAVATKTVATLTAAAIVTAGAVEVQHAQQPRTRRAPMSAAVAAPPAEPQVVASSPQPTASPPVTHARLRTAKIELVRHAAKKQAAGAPAATATTPTTTTTAQPVLSPAEGSDTSTLPVQNTTGGNGQPQGDPQEAPTPTPAPAPSPQPAATTTTTPAPDPSQPPPPGGGQDGRDAQGAPPPDPQPAPGLTITVTVPAAAP
jgi:RNA polymerase sigma factor (sigma-70 family)